LCFKNLRSSQAVAVMVNQQDLKPLWRHAEAIIIPLALDQFFVGLVNTWHLITKLCARHSVKALKR